jgi:hypothetical protein
MNRPRLIRGLRIAWSVWWGILCALLVVLWVRSYSFRDMVSVPSSTKRTRTHFFVSARGQILYGSRDDYHRLPPPFGPQREIEHESVEYYISHPQIGMIRGFEWVNRGVFKWGYPGFAVPDWFGSLVIAFIATMPWIHWSRKFSLRTLLIATTLVAVVLGLVVWSSS